MLRSLHSIDFYQVRMLNDLMQTFKTYYNVIWHIVVNKYQSCWKHIPDVMVQSWFLGREV